MATGGEEQVGYSLANVRTLTLERNTEESPYYISIAICQENIILVDNKDKVKIHRLQNGKFLDMFDSESPPRNICLMDTTTICVLHYDGLIETASIKSEDKSPVVSRRKRLRLHGVLLDIYHCVVSFNDNIVVVGEKQGAVYWCMVSLDDGNVNTINFICKGSIWSDVIAKDTMIYVSCCAGVTSPNTGVYAFDIITPSQCRYNYKHKRLQKPTSIVINGDGNIFVGNFGVHVSNGVIQDSCIHQLTASCQLVTIFTQGIPGNITAMFWDHGRMYVTCNRSRDITVFRHVYQGSHKASDVLVSDERNHPGIKEASIQISQGNADNGQLSVKTERLPSGSSLENNEDEKYGKHKDSEVPISDEQRQQVIEGTSTQIGHDIVDNGQLSVKTEITPSESSPENNKDEKHGNHNDSEVPISDKESQPIIKGTSIQIGQNIVDNVQSSVKTESLPSGSSPENNEVEKHGKHKDSEVPIRVEERLQVIEETFTQIGQVTVDNVQLSVETERPPSESSPENNEDQKHDNHKDSEVQITGKERQVIEWTSTEIEQDIVRPYIAQTACDFTAESAISQHTDSVIALSVSAVVPSVYPEQTLAPVSPPHRALPELEENPHETSDQENLCPSPSRRPEPMMPLERLTRPMSFEPVEPPVGRLYENLYSHPRFVFPGTPSTHHAAIATDLLRPMRETFTMTDAAPARQTVDIAVQCDIIQF